MFQSLKNILGYKIFLFMLIVFSRTSLQAQVNTMGYSSTNFWFYAGAGPVYYNGSGGILGSLGAEYVRGHSLYSIQYIVMDRIHFYEPVDARTGNKDFVQGIGFLYGRLYRRGILKFSYAAGLGIIDNTIRETSGDVVREKMTFTAGLPLSAQILLTPIKLLSVGIKIFANANAYNSFSGVGLAIYWGKVR